MKKNHTEVRKDKSNKKIKEPQKQADESYTYSFIHEESHESTKLKAIVCIRGPTSDLHRPCDGCLSLWELL